MHSTSLRTRRASLVVVGSCLNKGHCVGEGHVFFGARPWCDVQPTVSNIKPASRVSLGAGAAAALSVSGEEEQHSSYLRARVVSRWLWSSYGYS